MPHAMSRAFVKEGDGTIDLPELPLSPHPNHVTARGLAQLRARLADVEAALAAIPADAVDAAPRRAHLERDERWLRARIASALPFDASRLDHDRVGFGARVTVVDTDDATHAYRIVGEDEADPERGDVSWNSPLARALHGAAIGDTVTWRRPAGDREVEITAIDYD